MLDISVFQQSGFVNSFASRMRDAVTNSKTAFFLTTQLYH